MVQCKQTLNILFDRPIKETQLLAKAHYFYISLID